MTRRKNNNPYTAFNIAAFLAMAVGLPICALRFAKGLGSVTNLSDDSPFGLWIGFDVMSGVALAAGGFTLSAIVHLFGARDFRPVARPALLTAFLGYFLVGVGVAFDVGRPWRLPYPFFVSRGTASVMFEVACCVALYLTVLFLEVLPFTLKGARVVRLRSALLKSTIVLTIAGVTLSTMHQSSLGAMFLIAKGKLHPLWHSSHLPVYFFISALTAGFSMVILESSITHRVFKDYFDPDKPFDHDRIVLDLGKGAALILLGYTSLKFVDVWHEGKLELLDTPYGHWFLVEVLGFCLAPCVLYAAGGWGNSPALVKFTSAIAVLGVVLNRLNVCIVAFNWRLEASERYVPSVMEAAVSVMFVAIGLLAFRAIVIRFPILRDEPWLEGH